MEEHNKVQRYFYEMNYQNCEKLRRKIKFINFRYLEEASKYSIKRTDQNFTVQSWSIDSDKIKSKFQGHGKFVQRIAPPSNFPGILDDRISR